MICKLKIEIDINNINDDKAAQNKIFNSIIKNYSTQNYIDFLGENKLKPYTHYIKKDEDIIYWVINTLNEEAKQNIILPIMKSLPNEIYDEKNEINILIKDKYLEMVTYENLIARNYLINEQHNYITIRFNSPTSFKSQGNYKIIPEIDLMYKSIIQKYNEFSTDYEINDQDVLNFIIENTNIIDYNLKSVRFNMNNFRIPSFIGNIRIKIKGTEASKNLIHLLLDFASYSGIGIKTSLGMGGIEIKY